MMRNSCPQRGVRLDHGYLSPRPVAEPCACARYYWAPERQTQDGSRHLMGVKSPAIDAMNRYDGRGSSAEDFNAGHPYGA